MAFNIAQFRLDFPEFSNAVKYPDSLINFWSVFGGNLMDVCRWGALYATGLELLTAHYIVISAMNEATSAAGGIPGTSISGSTTSKKVGSASVSYDVSSMMIKDGGQYNQTIYGRQFLQLSKMIGMGCYQL